MITEAIARPIPTGEVVRVGADDQGADRLDDVGGEGEERERQQPQGLSFAGLGQAVPELPQDDQAAGDLDDRVESEADQRDRTRRRDRR